jgi:hypothetical protein
MSMTTWKRVKRKRKRKRHGRPLRRSDWRQEEEASGGKEEESTDRGICEAAFEG